MSSSQARILSTKELAAILSKGGEKVDARQVRRRLLRSGAIEKVGGRYYTTHAKLWETATPYAREMALGGLGES